MAPGSTGHNLVVQVVSVGATTEKPRFDGSVSKIVEVVVGDETGIVTLTARNGWYLDESTINWTNTMCRSN